MKVYFVEKFTEGDKDRQLEAMRKYMEFSSLEECDVIFCASIVMMNQAIAAKSMTNKPLVNYCWDYYLFAHNGKNQSWDWRQYAQFLKESDLIIVPSEGQKLRLKELLGLDSVVVRTGIPTYDMPEITDGNFILDPLRYYPEENMKWAEEAAAILNIPIIHSEHQYSQEEFQKLVASCTFLTSCVREASTGALTLMEGLYLGKPSLVSNSPYMGAKDYLGDFGTYFQYDRFTDLVEKMNEMWKNRKKIDIGEARAYMEKELSYDIMAKKLYENFHSLI